MVEVIDAVIKTKTTTKGPFSFSYEKGQVNYIDYSEIYKFNILLLKNQNLASGTLKIDDESFLDDNEKRSLFIITVNCLATFHLAFIERNEKKFARVKAIQEALIKTRDLPMNTDEEKKDKVTKILECATSLKPSYILFDFNNELVVPENFIKELLEQYQNQFIIVALNKKTYDSISEEDEISKKSDLDLSIGERNEQMESKPTRSSPMFYKQNSKDPFGKVFGKMFKDNVMVFLSFIAPALGVLAFSLLSPLYAQTNKVLLIPFIITICICFVLFMIMTYKCAIFENKQQLIAYGLINFGSITTAFGLSILFYYLFLNFDNEIKALNSKNLLGFVTASIFFVILVTAFLYIPPFVNWVLNLFKKKK